MSETLLKNPVLQATGVVSRASVLHAKSRAEWSQVTAELNNHRGVYVKDLPDGTVLELETVHHRYTLVKRANGQALISGHPLVCPEPVLVEIEGSVGSGSMLRLGFIGYGMHLKFVHPTYGTVATSRILDLRQIG